MAITAQMVALVQAATYANGALADRELLRGFTLQQLSRALYALARLAPRPGIDAASGSSVDATSSTNAQGPVVPAVVPAATLAALCEACLQTMRGSRGSNHSSSSSWTGSSRGRENRLFEWTVGINRIGPQASANICWALARQGYCHKELLDELAEGALRVAADAASLCSCVKRQGMLVSCTDTDIAHCNSNKL